MTSTEKRLELIKILGRLEITTLGLKNDGTGRNDYRIDNPEIVLDFLSTAIQQAEQEILKKIVENIKQETKKNPNFVFYDLDKDEIGQDLLDVIYKE